MRSNVSSLVRLAGALLVAAAGAIHLWLYFDYFHRVHVVGALFLVNAAAAGAVVVSLLWSRASWPLACGALYSLGTLAAFFISVYRGLFGYVESLGGAWQLGAAGVELAATAALAFAAAADQPQSGRRFAAYRLVRQVDPRRQR